MLSLLALGQYWGREGEKTEELRDLAAKIGFSFQEEDTDFEASLKKTRCFSRSYRARTTNCLSKKNEVVEIKVADCHYSQSDKVYRATVCMIIDKQMNLPNFFLRPEHKFFDGLKRFFGMQDIEFENDQAFSKKFVLQSEDEISVKYLFNSEVRKFMMKYGDLITQIEGNGSMLLLFKKPQFVSDFETQVKEALEICTLLKKVVEKEGLNS